MTSPSHARYGLGLQDYPSIGSVLTRQTMASVDFEEMLVVSGAVANGVYARNALVER